LGSSVISMMHSALHTICLMYNAMSQISLFFFCTLLSLRTVVSDHLSICLFFGRKVMHKHLFLCRIFRIFLSQIHNSNIHFGNFSDCSQEYTNFVTSQGVVKSNLVSKP